jgi:hypothetical protein
VRRPLKSLLVAAGAVVALGGCSSDDDSSNSPGGSGQAPNGPGAETAPKPKHVAAPKGIARPRAVEDSGTLAARAVEKVLGREVSPGQPMVIGAACEHGDCIVRYRSQARGGGHLVSNQDRMLRPLFARRGVRSVTLYVHHWSVGTPDKNEAPVFATTICRRREHPAFHWGEIGPGDVVRVCHYTRVAGGKLRSEVRRGKLSNKQASQGKGNGRGGGPQGPK